MMQGLLVNNLHRGGVWIMTQPQAFRCVNDQRWVDIVPTVTEELDMVGYPVVASENLPASGGSPANGYPLIFALASEIMLADDGQIVLTRAIRQVSKWIPHLIHRRQLHAYVVVAK
jgi:hypothetical protein